MFADKIWFGAIPEIYLKHGSHRLAEENCSELQISKSKMEKMTNTSPEWSPVSMEGVWCEQAEGKFTTQGL